MQKTQDHQQFRVFDGMFFQVFCLIVACLLLIVGKTKIGIDYMAFKSYYFTHAITRKPSSSIIDGLRAVDIGAPDIATFEQHHADYVALLKSMGAEVVELEALEAFPDSVFIEDDALCFQEGVVLMRPGAPSRLGEVNEIAPALRALYKDCLLYTSPSPRDLSTSRMPSSA